MALQILITMMEFRKVRKNFMYSITVTYDHDSTPEGKKNFIYGITVTYDHDSTLEGKKKFHIWHYSYV